MAGESVPLSPVIGKGQLYVVNVTLGMCLSVKPAHSIVVSDDWYLVCCLCPQSSDPVKELYTQLVEKLEAQKKSPLQPAEAPTLDLGLHPVTVPTPTSAPSTPLWKRAGLLAQGTVLSTLIPICPRWPFIVVYIDQFNTKQRSLKEHENLYITDHSSVFPSHILKHEVPCFKIMLKDQHWNVYIF